MADYAECDRIARTAEFSQQGMQYRRVVEHRKHDQPHLRITPGDHPEKRNPIAEVAGRLIASTDDALYAWADDHWTPIVENLPHARIAPQSETDGRWVYAARNEIGWIGLRSDPVTLERIPAPGR